MPTRESILKALQPLMPLDTGKPVEEMVAQAVRWGLVRDAFRQANEDLVTQLRAVLMAVADDSGNTAWSRDAARQALKLEVRADGVREEE